MAYASPYYDPIKAHEYYMLHRKLKGRKHSTATLNEKGKKAADYVKNQIGEEKKRAVSSERSSRDQKIEAEKKSYSDRVFSQTQTAKVRISNLQKKYSKLSSAQKRILGPKIKKELERMKQENESKRQQLLRQHSKTVQNINESSKNNIKNINEKYSKTYENELGKMNADSSMVKQKKTKTTKTQKSSTKKSSTKTTSNDAALKAKYKKIVDDAMARYEQRKKKK